MINNYNFEQKFKLANITSLILVLLSILMILFKGLNFGIDFKGGTLMELRCDSTNIQISDVRSSFNQLDLGDINVKEFGNNIDFRRVENVGPKVSKELLESGLLAISLALAAMLFYIWVRFEWQFSIGSIIAIFHDVLITIGLFSLLSLEINLSIVAAVLTIVGYSMNDTVVIYDRIRENLIKYSSLKIGEISNKSINETLSRTIITSSTTLLALISIFILGGEILKGFSLAMIIGVVIGTYSSIFVASPILKYFNVSFKTISKEKENN